MRNYLQILKLEEIKDAQGGAGGKTPEPKTPPTAGDKKVDPPVEEEGDKFDELGYEKKKPKPGDKKPDTKPPEEKEPVKIEPASGYDKEPVIPAEEPPAPAAKDPNAPPELELQAEGLDAAEVKEVKEFAKTHKLTKEQAQAWVDKRKLQLKNDSAAIAQARAEAIKKAQLAQAKQRADWYNENKNHPTFGGENFLHNVQQAEKVLQEFMPDTKKRLTENKGMLPPYFMRELKGLADVLFGDTAKFRNGDPIPPAKKEDEASDDPLDFYKQKAP